VIGARIALSSVGNPEQDSSKRADAHNNPNDKTNYKLNHTGLTLTSLAGCGDDDVEAEAGDAADF